MNKLLNKINPVNTGKKWTEDEEKLLLKRLKENIDIKTIAEIHNRNKGGIRARCRLIAYRMHLKNIPIDEISDITKLNNDNIIKIIERKESKINKQNIKNFNIIEIIKKIDNVIICDDIKKIKLTMMEIKNNFEELYYILTRL